MGVDLRLIKYVLTPLECFAAIKGNSSCVSNRCSYSEQKTWIKDYYTANRKQGNERYKNG